MIGVLIVIVLCFGIWYFDLLTRYSRLWDNIPMYKEIKREAKLSVSIIIPFRNEAERLGQLIESINEVEINSLEVNWLFMDDHSYDHGAELLTDGLSDHVSWQLHTLDGITGKKAAIEKAWELTASDIIVQTDADCSFGKGWLLAMVAPFNRSDIHLVSGPVQYVAQEGFWHRIVSLDFAGLIAIGAAHIQWRKPLICNGANMAYRRSLISDINMRADKASGDDVFILQSAFRKDSAAIAFQKDIRALVLTQGPSSFREFWHQRIRWASKNGEYDIRVNRIILMLVWLYNVTIVLSLSSMNSVGVLMGFFLIIVKLLAEDKFYGSFADYFGVSGWFRTIFLGQPFHILYMTVIPPLSQILQYKWKERKQK